MSDPSLENSEAGGTPEIEVPEGYVLLSQDELDSKYASRDELKDTHVLQAEVQRRFRNWVSRDKAHEDEAVVAKVLEQHKSKPGVDLEQAKEGWRKAELEPVAGRLETLTQRLMASEIREAASQVFDDPFVKAPPGVESWAEAALSKMFQFDPEYGYTIAVSNGAPVPAQKPTQERPYAGVGEHLARIVQDPAWAPYLKRDPKNAGGPGGPGGGAAADMPTSKRDMTTEQVAEFVRKNGSDAYLKLPD